MREILCWVLLLLAAYPLLRRCSSGKKPVRTGLVSSALGFAGLAAASIQAMASSWPGSPSRRTGMGCLLMWNTFLSSFSGWI